jgi:hypothetical protein
MESFDIIEITITGQMPGHVKSEESN